MAQKIIRESRRVTEKYKRLEYTLKSDPGAGFSFDCDDNGNIIFQPEFEDAQKESYQYVQDNINLYDGPFINTYSHSYRENAIALCECGEEIELYDEYMGACECPNCNRWHNLFGQTLKAPTEWEYDY